MRIWKACTKGNITSAFVKLIENEIRELFESIEIAASKEVTARQKLKVYWLTRLQKLEKMCNLSQVLKEEIMDHAITIFNLKRKHLQEEFKWPKAYRRYKKSISICKNFVPQYTYCPQY